MSPDPFITAIPAASRAIMCSVSFQRSGGAAHLWMGPLGLHVFRHKGARNLRPLARWSPVWLEWSPKQAEPVPCDICGIDLMTVGDPIAHAMEHIDEIHKQRMAAFRR